MELGKGLASDLFIGFGFQCEWTFRSQFVCLWSEYCTIAKSSHISNILSTLTHCIWKRDGDLVYSEVSALSKFSIRSSNSVGWVLRCPNPESKKSRMHWAEGCVSQNALGRGCLSRWGYIPECIGQGVCIPACTRQMWVSRSMGVSAWEQGVCPGGVSQHALGQTPSCGQNDRQV